MPETDLPQPQTQENTNTQTPSAKPKVDPLKVFQEQVANGPLPALVKQVEAQWVKNKWIVVLLVTAIVLLVMIIVGAAIGGIFGALSTKKVSITPLPTVIPTDRPKIPSIFDDLKQEIVDFNTILPDPAPPAVDQDISLEPKKN
jgi:hypothetical protein